MADLSIIDPTLASISASSGLLALLRDLHTQALSEASYVSSDSQPHTVALTRFVALDPDKCAFVYLLLRSSGARNVVEAGTSFGLSTIYLALAVGQNVAAGSGHGQGKGKVIATENEPTKAAKAKQYWREAGSEVEPWIELREGDLRETLKTDLPEEIDFVLLDIWAPLALPTLQLVHAHLKIGAQVLVDNSVAASKGYSDLIVYLDDPKNGFRRTDLPYSGGLLLAVYVGRGIV